MRFGDNPSGCSILPGLELCPNEAKWKIRGNYFCDAHKVQDSQKYISNLKYSVLTCDRCLPRIFCKNPPTWNLPGSSNYRNMTREYHFLCNVHADEYKAMFPDNFDKPRPEGWGMRKLSDEEIANLLEKAKLINF